jgi:hypothetical protein
MIRTENPEIQLKVTLSIGELYKKLQHPNNLYLHLNILYIVVATKKL